MADGAAAATVAGVRSESLNAQQLERLARGVRHWCRFINCLSGRAHQTHFPSNDPLKLAADKAQSAAVELEAVVKQLQEREAKNRPPPISPPPP